MNETTHTDDEEAEIDPEALRAWMLRVNNILLKKSLIDGETRRELHNEAFRATGKAEEMNLTDNSTEEDDER